ncbi:hypothetical protein CERZMDRAFT_87647 [Cercospora zeae-maydis SCOH1-5]|uniref:Ras modification protein ERF4 n=1 Tax=Cercospora zeae-maydis SCOH1-5 TaxID=717836 RepID=A0A6A6F7V4_9PEZI|nr:hypothetical protein CERZMDRAFT_87647 [Cercospora zeae-maydis SCOH1-5]
MDTLHKIAGVTEAQRSDASSPPPAANIVTLHSNKSTTTIPPPPPPKDDAKSERWVSVPIKRRLSQKSLRSVKSARSARSKGNKSTKSRNASRTSLGLRDENVPPPPKLTASERNQYGNLPAQPVAPRSSASRAGSIRSSWRTRRAETQGEEDAGDSDMEEEDDEFEWGPQHPCFPHPNTHCAPQSQEFEETRVVRVKRDYLIAGDLYPQFANLYPEILDPLVTDDEFRDLILHINAILLNAFSPYTVRAWADTILGVATGYFWDDLGFTGAKAGERTLEGWIEMWNEEKQKEGRQVKLIGPRTTGFMSLDFVIPDPGIDIAVDSDDDEEEEEEAADAVAGDQQIGIEAALQT